MFDAIFFSCWCVASFSFRLYSSLAAVCMTASMLRLCIAFGAASLTGKRPDLLSTVVSVEVNPLDSDRTDLSALM